MIINTVMINVFILVIAFPKTLRVQIPNDHILSKIVTYITTIRSVLWTLGETFEGRFDWRSPSSAVAARMAAIRRPHLVDGSSGP